MIELVYVALGCLIGSGSTLAVMRSRHRHEHEWSAWSDWAEIQKGYYTRWTRQRFCETCAAEELREVGKHKCSDFQYATTKCTHRKEYQPMLDMDYAIRQREKKLGLD